MRMYLDPKTCRIRFAPCAFFGTGRGIRAFILLGLTTLLVQGCSPLMGSRSKYMDGQPVTTSPDSWLSDRLHGAHPLSYDAFRVKDSLNPVISGGPSGASCGPACQKLRQEFRYVVYVGAQVYAYASQRDSETHPDFAALATQLHASITTQTDLRHYQGILQQWAAAFHNGHVNSLLPSAMTPDSAWVSSTPIRLELLAPGTDHEAIIATATGATANVAVGDELVQVGALAAMKALEQLLPTISASTDASRRARAARRLLDTWVDPSPPANLPLSLTFRHAGNLVKITVARTPESSPLSGNASLNGAATPDFQSALVTAAAGSPTYGYLRVDSFADPAARASLTQWLDWLGPTQGWILDLRHNSGGAPVGDAILERLLSSAAPMGQSSARVNDFVLAAHPQVFPADLTPAESAAGFTRWQPWVVQPSSQSTATGKLVAVLLGPDCQGACDTLVAALKQQGLAHLLGETSGGTTGAPLAFDLPASGGQFRYPVVRNEGADGATLEGSGTVPDERIEGTVDEHQQGRDLVLEQAFEWLSPGTSALASQVIAQTGPSWSQSLTIAPTRLENERLRRSFGADEWPAP